MDKDYTCNLIFELKIKQDLYLSLCKVILHKMKEKMNKTKGAFYNSLFNFTFFKDYFQKVCFMGFVENYLEIRNLFRKFKELF